MLCWQANLAWWWANRSTHWIILYWSDLMMSKMKHASSVVVMPCPHSACLQNSGKNSATPLYHQTWAKHYHSYHKLIFKFSEWKWYNLLFMGYCQSFSVQFSKHMKHKYQSREWDLPLLGDAIAASHYQHLTLEGTGQHDTAHLHSYQSCCFQLQEVLTSSPYKSLPQPCSQVYVTA